MHSITIDRDKAVEALKKNKAGHRKIFEEALEGYKKQVITTLSLQLNRAKRGEKVDQYISFPQPEDHTSDYDRVIQMLEWSEDSTISLSESDFAQYVLDDWGWKGQFLTSNSMYSATAASSLQKW